MNILALTVCCMDVYPDSGKITIGGNALNYAVQCLKSGVEKTAILGAVGTDQYGKDILDYLKSKPIDISHLHTVSGKTASNKIYINQDGDRYFLPDSWDGGVYTKYRLTAEDCEYMNRFDVIATLYNEPDLDTILCNRKKPEIVMDYLDSRDFTGMDRLLSETTISFISGSKEILETVRILSQKQRALIVVTMGAEGSRAYNCGKEYIMPAEKVDRVVDTTGCGDAYQAAFAVSWFRDCDIQKAMKKGSEAAAVVTEFYGGVHQD
jgi:sugar/nucleoside kinase (ribokinase family)